MFCLFPGHGQAMVTGSQQQLMQSGVAVSMDGGAGVEMMAMDSLDPTLLQMKTEVNQPTVELFVLDDMTGC